MRKEQRRSRLSGICLECFIGFLSYPELEQERLLGNNRMPWVAIFDCGYKPEQWVREGRV